jgi:hypothetical protein
MVQCVFANSSCRPQVNAGATAAQAVGSGIFDWGKPDALGWD